MHGDKKLQLAIANMFRRNETREESLYIIIIHFHLSIS